MSELTSFALGCPNCQAELQVTLYQIRKRDKITCSACRRSIRLSVTREVLRILEREAGIHEPPRRDGRRPWGW